MMVFEEDGASIHIGQRQRQRHRQTRGKRRRDSPMVRVRRIGLLSLAWAAAATGSVAVVRHAEDSVVSPPERFERPGFDSGETSPLVVPTEDAIPGAHEWEHSLPPVILPLSPSLFPQQQQQQQQRAPPNHYLKSLESTASASSQLGRRLDRREERREDSNSISRDDSDAPPARFGFMRADSDDEEELARATSDNNSSNNKKPKATKQKEESEEEETPRERNGGSFRRADNPEDEDEEEEGESETAPPGRTIRPVGNRWNSEDDEDSEEVDGDDDSESSLFLGLRPRAENQEDGSLAAPIPITPEEEEEEEEDEGRWEGILRPRANDPDEGLEGEEEEDGGILRPRATDNEEGLEAKEEEDGGILRPRANDPDEGLEAGEEEEDGGILRPRANGPDEGLEAEEEEDGGRLGNFRDGINNNNNNDGAEDARVDAETTDDEGKEEDEGGRFGIIRDRPNNGGTDEEATSENNEEDEEEENGGRFGIIRDGINNGGMDEEEGDASTEAQNDRDRDDEDESGGRFGGRLDGINGGEEDNEDENVDVDEREEDTTNEESNTDNNEEDEEGRFGGIRDVINNGRGEDEDEPLTSNPGGSTNTTDNEAANEEDEGGRFGGIGIGNNDSAGSTNGDEEDTEDDGRQTFFPRPDRDENNNGEGDTSEPDEPEEDSDGLGSRLDGIRDNDRDPEDDVGGRLDDDDTDEDDNSQDSSSNNDPSNEDNNNSGTSETVQPSEEFSARNILDLFWSPEDQTYSFFDENGFDKQAPPDGGGNLYYSNGALMYAPRSLNSVDTSSTNDDESYDGSIVAEPNPSAFFNNPDDDSITSRPEEGRRPQDEEGDGIFSRPEGRPQGEEDDIDCTRFQFLDVCQSDDEEEPPEGTDPPIPPPPASDYDGIPPANVVSVQLSVGLRWRPRNLELMEEVIGRVVTFILDTFTPFQAYYWGSSAEEGGSSRRPERPEEPFGRLLMDTIDYDGRRKERSLLRNRNKEDADSGPVALWDASLQHRHEPFLSERFPGNRLLREDNNRPGVDLMYAWTFIEELSSNPDPVYPSGGFSSDIFWYLTTVEFAAFWGISPAPIEETPVSVSGNPGSNQGRFAAPVPIRRPNLINNITWLCQLTVNNTIDNGIFLDNLEPALRQVLESMYDGVLPGQDTSTSPPADNGNGDPGTSPPAAPEIDEPDFVAGVSVVGKEDEATSTINGNSFDDGPGADSLDGGVYYSDQLDLEFGMREWLGVALFCATSFVSIILFAWASHLQRNIQFKSSSNPWSAAVFTEQGIADILKVGWRYQEANEYAGYNNNASTDANELGNQLFLQVYDKSKLGYYNDESSLLQGGIEQELVLGERSATSPTTEAATTAVWSQPSTPQSMTTHDSTAHDRGLHNNSPHTSQDDEA